MPPVRLAVATSVALGAVLSIATAAIPGRDRVLPATSVRVSETAREADAAVGFGSTSAALRCV
jgi:hypothetical protein